MPRSPVAIAVLAVAALLAGCTKQSEVAQRGSIEFRVNAERLGARFEHSGTRLALRAPAGWNPLADSLIAEAMRRVGADAQNGPVLIAMFRQEPEGAALTVSGYPASLGLPALDSLAVARLAALRTAHAGAKIDDGRFSYHGYEIVQFRTVDAQMVSFQLLVSERTQPLMQLDYVVPRSIYPRELESVESSIGSLEPLS